jgi:hypothetical protein
MFCCACLEGFRPRRIEGVPPFAGCRRKVVGAIHELPLLCTDERVLFPSLDGRGEGRVVWCRRSYLHQVERLLTLAELVGSATPLRSCHAMHVASGLVPDGGAFVRRRVGRYIGPRRQSARLTYSASLNNAIQHAPQPRRPALFVPFTPPLSSHPPAGGSADAPTIGVRRRSLVPP